MRQVSGGVVGLLGDRAARLQARGSARPGVRTGPGGSRSRRRCRSAGQRWCRSPSPRSSRACIVVEPVAVVDRLRMVGVAAQHRLVLELEVLGQVSTIAWAPSPAISWFQSSTSCSTVIVGNVAGSTSCGTRPRTSSASVDHDVAGGGPGERRPPTRRRTPRQRRARRRTAAVGSASAPSPPGGHRVANRPRRSAAEAGCGDEPVEEGTSRAHDDEAAQQGDLRPELVVCGAMSSVLATATRNPNTTRPTRPAGTVFGSVIMKNRKIRSSGEVDDHPPVVEPADRRERPARGHAVAGRGERRRAPTASVSQNVTAAASRCSRAVINSPPTRITV